MLGLLRSPAGGYAGGLWLLLGLLALVQAQRLTAHHRLIDVFYVHDALPFRLSLSKPFDRL